MKTFGFLKESGGPLHFLKESLRKVGGPLHFLKESLRKVGGPLHFLKDSLRNLVCFRIHLANWGGPPQIRGGPPFPASPCEAFFCYWCKKIIGNKNNYR